MTYKARHHTSQNPPDEFDDALAKASQAAVDEKEKAKKVEEEKAKKDAEGKPP